jgi:hypothetical protein
MKVRRMVSSVSLREIYEQPGEFTAKMLIDPAASQGIESVEVEVRDSDGKKMSFDSKRWGTKLTVSFVIDAGTPDGVSVIDFTLHPRNRPIVRERFSFWVIKD